MNLLNIKPEHLSRLAHNHTEEPPQQNNKPKGLDLIKLLSTRNITTNIATSTKKDGLEFDSIDSKPVQIIVLILSPTDAPVPHIQFLAAISKVLSDSATREKISNAQSPTELLKYIKEKTESES